jgi:hypothetical protein
MSLCSNLLVLPHAVTCQHSLPELNKELFIDRDMMVITFTWHLVYGGHTKEQCAKNVNLLPHVYVAHLMVQKEDNSLARVTRFA